MLSTLVAEAATWFFGDPVFTNGRSNRPDVSNASLRDLLEAVLAATTMLEQVGADRSSVGGGAAVVDAFCQRFMGDEPDYKLVLSSGRSIGQRQLLCALTLQQLELAAQAMATGDAAVTVARMTDVLEVVCEVRRALDREAGSDVAARLSRKRHERNYRIRRKAEELFDSTPGGSIAQRANAIYPEVAEFAEQIGSRLTPTRGPKTVYDWLTAYRKASATVSGNK